MAVGGGESRRVIGCRKRPWDQLEQHTICTGKRHGAKDLCTIGEHHGVLTCSLRPRPERNRLGPHLRIACPARGALGAVRAWAQAAGIAPAHGTNSATAKIVPVNVMHAPVTYLTAAAPSKSVRSGTAGGAVTGRKRPVRDAKVDVPPRPTAGTHGHGMSL